MTIFRYYAVNHLVHLLVKYSRPPDLKSSSNVSLTFAWITGPATDLSYSNHPIRQKEIHIILFYLSGMEHQL